MSEFKVGDIVRRVSDSSCYWANSKPDGDIFEIVEVTASKDIRLRGSESYFYDKNFALVKYPNPPHKHKDLIVAWASGAEIECMGEWGNGWQPIKTPSWQENITYRIKSTKSPTQIQIEELEAKAKELLDKVKELRGGG